MNSNPPSPDTLSPESPQSSGKYGNRTRARTVVFQILYQEDMNPGSGKQFSEDFLREELPDHAPLLDFARSLVQNVFTDRKQIDKQIEQLSTNWSISRMSATDRNILRLAICEMQIFKTPKPIVINEAVELAKSFGTKDSASFVNGILDKYGVGK